MFFIKFSLFVPIFRNYACFRFIILINLLTFATKLKFIHHIIEH